VTDHRRAVGSAAWASVFHILQQVVFLVWLTRLLRPEDYGDFGMVAVFLLFVGLLAEPGIGPALVQRPEVDRVHLDSAFWFSSLLGALCAAAFALLAPTIAAFYGLDRLEPLARALAVTFLLNGIAIVPRAVLQRRMAVGGLMWIDVAAVLTGGALAVAMALRGLGAWSLVGQQLAVAAIPLLLVAWSARWRPGFSARWTAMRELLGYSGRLLGTSAVSYWARNTDNLLVGKLLGSAALGVYSRAFTLMFMPLTQANMLVGRVLFPTLCALQGELERFRRTYLRASTLLVLFIVPVMLGLFASAPWLVLALFGPRWVGVIGVLRLLSLAGVVQALYLPTSWVFAALGRMDLLLRWATFTSAVVVAGIAAGAALGSSRAVAGGYLLGSLAVLWPALKMPARVMELRPVDLLRPAFAPLACAALMAGTVWGAGILLDGREPALVLAVQVTIGVLLYAGLLAWAGVESLRDLMVLLVGERRGSAAFAQISRARSLS
jgi:O-antigen/teichoic acid export membrane protein